MIIAEDIPSKHLDYFIACNSGNWLMKQDFYKFKSQFLRMYGQESGVDLQIIKRVCNNCKGSALHWDGKTCLQCEKGIYRTDMVELRRFLINGHLFHEPIDRIYKVEFITKYNNVIHGLIEHEPKQNQLYYYLMLLLIYDRQHFFEVVMQLSRRYRTRTKHKYITCLKELSYADALKKFFGIKEVKEELPF